MLIEITGQKTISVVKVLRGIPEIRALHTTNGAWDLVAEIAKPKTSPNSTVSCVMSGLWTGSPNRRPACC